MSLWGPPRLNLFPFLPWEFTQALHFLTPGGEDVVVEQGRYEVGQASEWLRLTPVGGEKSDAILVEAQLIDHTETIEVPTILLLSEHEDEDRIMLLLPDGTGLEALGSYSGVRSKRVRRPSRRPRAARSSKQSIGPAKSARQRAEVASEPSLKRLPGTIKPDSSTRKIRPKTQPDGRIGNTPNKGADSKPNLPDMGPIPGPPQITGAGLQPHKKIGNVPGKLAPAGTIVIFGNNLGTREGTVRLRVDPKHFPEYPNGVPLRITSWSDTMVKANIPSPMTGPIFSVNVAIRLSRVNPAKTVEYIKAFQVPVDRKILKRIDEAVRLVNCYPTGNGEDSCLGEPQKTISGSHSRDFGSSSGGHVFDQFAIYLRNGWVFSRLLDWHTRITGDDGDYVKKPKGFPVGKTSWTPSVPLVLLLG